MFHLISFLTSLSIFSSFLFSFLIFTFSQITDSLTANWPCLFCTCTNFFSLLFTHGHSFLLFTFLPHLRTQQAPPLALHCFRAQTISRLFRVLWTQASIATLLWEMEALTHSLPSTTILLLHLLYSLLLTKDFLHVYLRDEHGSS